MGFTVCIMKGTGAGTCSCAVCSVQCAVCSVLPATGEHLAVEIGFFQHFTFKSVLEQ